MKYVALILSIKLHFYFSYFDKICKANYSLGNVCPPPLMHFLALETIPSNVSLIIRSCVQIVAFSYNCCNSRGVTSILGIQGGVAPKFASEIRVRVPNLASKNIGDKYPKFCPLNFRYAESIPQVYRYRFGRKHRFHRFFKYINYR